MFLQYVCSLTNLSGLKIRTSDLTSDLKMQTIHSAFILPQTDFSII